MIRGQEEVLMKTKNIMHIYNKLWYAQQKLQWKEGEGIWKNWLEGKSIFGWSIKEDMLNLQRKHFLVYYELFIQICITVGESNNPKERNHIIIPNELISWTQQQICLCNSTVSTLMSCMKVALSKNTYVTWT